MVKELSEMTIEELWELFPITLTKHNDEWEVQYEEMAGILKEKLTYYKIVHICHIGSTAIKSIWAKPIVDILVEIDIDEDMHVVSKVITSCGFILMSASESRMSFNYGYTTKGFADKVFHLHLRYKGDNSELFFRDYLNEHSDVAKEYESLKMNLWHKYEHDRDGYTGAKTEFIEKFTQIAKSLYGNRY